MKNSAVISSVEPLEKRPMHAQAAQARGLDEPFESVFVIRGFCTEGHVHAPIIWRGRYFRPFVTHKDDTVHTCSIQLLMDDPKNPFKEGGDLSKYEGDVQMYENVCAVRRPSSNSPEGVKWVLRTLDLTLYEPITKLKTEKRVTNVLAWRSGADSQTANASKTVPFCVKAVELTKKEIEAHKNFRKQSDPIPA